MAINGMSHQLFKAGFKARDVYPELKKFCYKQLSNMKGEEFLMTKFALWIITRSSIDNTLHGSGMEVDKGMLLQIKKAPETSGGDLTCHVFSFEDAEAHLNVTNPKKFSTIET